MPRAPREATMWRGPRASPHVSGLDAGPQGRDIMGCGRNRELGRAECGPCPSWAAISSSVTGQSVLASCSGQVSGVAVSRRGHHSMVPQGPATLGAHKLPGTLLTES